jgi:hypothetical protein
MVALFRRQSIRILDQPLEIVDSQVLAQMLAIDDSQVGQAHDQPLEIVESQVLPVKQHILDYLRPLFRRLLLPLLLLAACSTDPAAPAQTDPAAAPHGHDHDAAAAAPHDHAGGAPDASGHGTGAHAHASPHGGEVKVLGANHVEAVFTPGGILFYVSDASEAGLPASSFTGSAVVKGPAGVETIALTPMGDETALNTLASRIVKEFDIFRAPLSDADIARRLKSPLTPRQHEYLMQFGYPHVHEEFRFHMTLTGPLHEEEREVALAHLKAAFAREVPEPVTTIDRICLFRQAHAADKFKRVDCAPLR